MRLGLLGIGARGLQRHRMRGIPIAGSRLVPATEALAAGRRGPPACGGMASDSAGAARSRTCVKPTPDPGE